MKRTKKSVLYLMLLGMIIMPMQTVQANFFSYQNAEDIMKNVVTGSLTAGIVMASYYYFQDYYEAQRHNIKVTIVPSKEEKQESQESDSNLRIYYPGDIQTTFDDIAGLSGAKADMQDIISFLLDPQAFYDIGAKVPTGVLMCGQPGNGKTLLARAVAGMVNCPFISLSASAFAEMYVGVGAYRVRELFKMAKKLSTRYGACIIFIDEIDAIAQKRSGTGGVGDRDYNQTIAQLLQSMDGLDKNEYPIIVLAATNRMEVLDPAIIRPGRFDRHVQVTKPEINDRETLLSNALDKVTHDSDINITRLARITSGFSGAELANLINEAAILAVQSGKTYVDVYDIELAFDHVTLGREITGGERNDQDKWETAIHEAGHAVGYLFGNNKKYAIYKASIVPRSNSLGVIWTIEMHESHKLTEDDMRATIVMGLCGGYAEQIFGFGKSTGPSSDLAQAHRIAYSMVVRYGMSQQLNYISYDEIDFMLPNDIATRVHKEVEKIIQECCVQAEQLILSHKKEITMIANLLMEAGTVLGDDIYTLVGLPLPDLKLRLV